MTETSLDYGLGRLAGESTVRWSTIAVFTRDLFFTRDLLCTSRISSNLRAFVACTKPRKALAPVCSPFVLLSLAHRSEALQKGLGASPAKA